MPAPNRRNVGASLQHQINGHSAVRGVADDRDRLKAQMVRMDKRWEDAAARLRPAARQKAADERESEQDPCLQIEAASNQQNSSAAFRRVLDTPCPAHGVSPGRPCWSLTAVESNATKRVVCGRRINAAGFHR